MKAVAAMTLASGLGFCASVAASDGEMDTSFGAGGIARVGITDADDGPSRCRPVLQPDQKILICGTRLENGMSGSDFYVARFNSDGTLDASFGTGGIVTVDFDGGAGGDHAEGIALQSDGRIVVAGTTHGAALQSDDFAVARLDADGALDGTFASGGKATIAFDLADGVGNDDVHAVAIAPDGTIVVAGSAETTGGSVVAIARLLSTGVGDMGFNSTGKVTFGFTAIESDGQEDTAQGIAIDSQGRSASSSKNVSMICSICTPSANRNVVNNTVITSGPTMAKVSTMPRLRAKRPNSPATVTSPAPSGRGG